MPDLLHGTVFHTISIKSMTLVFSSTASKLNYFLEHTSLVLVSAPGRSALQRYNNDCILYYINGTQATRGRKHSEHCDCLTGFVQHYVGLNFDLLQGVLTL